MASNGKVELSTALDKFGNFGKFHYWLLWCILPCSLSGVMVVNTITFIMPVISCEMNIPKYRQGLLFSAVYIGMVFGGLIWGAMADVIGRRTTLLILLSVTAVLENSTIFMFDYWELFIAKVCSGFMSSGIMTIAYTYVNEFVSPKDRDRMTMSYGMVTAFGYFVQPCIAIFTLPQNFDFVIIPHFLEINNWKAFQFLCALFPITAFLVFYFILKESPAFLLRKGREKEALEVLKMIYTRNTNKPAETFEITEVYLKETSVGDSGKDASFWNSVKTLCSRPYIITLIIVVICQYITMAAFAGVRSHLATIITMAFGIGQKANVNATTLSLTFCKLFETQVIFQKKVDCSQGEVNLSPLIYVCAAILGLFICLSFIPVTNLVKWIGKSLAFIVLHYIGAVCMGLMPYVQAYPAVAILTIFSISMQNCITISVSLIVGRIPTNIRGLTLSIVLIGGRIGVIMGSMLLPIMTDYSCPIGFWSIGFLNLLSLPLILLYSTQRNPIQEKLS